MENEIAKKTSVVRRTLIILTIILTSFIVYYSLMSVYSPVKKLSSLKEEYIKKPDEKNTVDERIYSDSLYLKLLREKAFLQSKVAMAETDSIYLSINLPDSTISIEISGVLVHMTKISDIKASKILLKGDENIVLSMLATPMTIADSYSTIRKEPVMIKMAPKDTSEYKPDIMPDTSFTEPVNYILEMTDGTRIYVYQQENDKFNERMNRFIFDLNDRLHETWTVIKSIAVLKVPEYNLFLKIRIPRADAKIIYRALPKNGQIAVYI